MQEVRNLILDVVPEASFASAILGESGDTFLNGIVSIQRIILHFLHHQLLQDRILRLIQVIPNTTQELVESVFTKQLSHSFVSHHLMPDSLLGSIAVVDVRHVKMYLASLLVIPASDMLAFLDCFLRTLVGYLLGRVNHIHLGTNLFGKLGNVGRNRRI